LAVYKIINKIIFMPTEEQIKIFKKLKQYLEQKRYEDLGPLEPPNNHTHKFGIRKTNIKRGKICCYVQLISLNARKHPHGSVKVVVIENERNKNVKESSIGNDIYGHPSRHVFVVPIDYAFKLIDTI